MYLWPLLYNALSARQSVCLQVVLDVTRGVIHGAAAGSHKQPLRCHLFDVFDPMLLNIWTFCQGGGSHHQGGTMDHHRVNRLNQIYQISFQIKNKTSIDWIIDLHLPGNVFAVGNFRSCPSGSIGNFRKKRKKKVFKLLTWPEVLTFMQKIAKVSENVRTGLWREACKEKFVSRKTQALERLRRKYECWL